MDSYQITFAAWDKVATQYQDTFMNMDLYNDTYDIFCEKIANHQARIFEIGCGPGNITRYLLSKRPEFHIDAIDISPSMIQLAKENNPTASFALMDCREIDLVTEKYEAIICGFCLPYLSKEDCEKWVHDCAQILNKSGVLYFSTIEGKYEQSGYETGSTGDKMYVYYHEAIFLMECLEKNHFCEIEWTRIHYLKKDGSKSVHIICMARKE